MPEHVDISVVIPCYRCEKFLVDLCQRLKLALEKRSHQYEIILVNDYSPEADWKVIQELAEEDHKIKGVNFSRNFGQHYAISAGLELARGDCIVVMDGDLQDQPEDIEKLYDKAKKGYEIVYGITKQRGQNSAINQFFSKFYYTVYDFLTDGRESLINASFVLLSRTVVDNYNRIGDKRRQFAPSLKFLGFNSATVELMYMERAIGESGYSFAKKLQLAINGLTAHSTKLLQLGIYMGFFCSGFSFLLGAFVLVRKLLGLTGHIGWSSIVASVFFVGGLIMIILGVLGMYIESIIHEVKDRPIYIIKDKINF